MNLRNKTLILIVPLIIVPLVFTGLVSFNQFNKLSESKALSHADAMTNLLKNSFIATTNTAIANIEIFATNNIIKKHVVAGSHNANYTALQMPLLNLFKNYQDVYPEYYEIRILSPDGLENMRVTNRDLLNASDDESQSDYFKAFSSSKWGVQTVIKQNPDNKEMALYVIKSLYLRNDSVDAFNTKPILRGYLAITIDIDFIQEEINTNRFGDSGVLLITDEIGNILFSPSYMSLGNTLPEQLFDTGEELAEQGVMIVPFNNKEYLFKPSELTKALYLFTAIPLHELESASDELRIITVSILLVTVLIIIGLVYLALNFYILTPIKRLSEAAREMGRGNLQVKTDITSNDEIGRLATTFDEMLFNVNHSREQILDLAYRDSLTGLPNRRKYIEYLDSTIAGAKRNDLSIAVLYLDIDNFKTINDTLGHQVGDEFLKEIAERLSKLLREDDSISLVHAEDTNNIVARLGGDEFIITLIGITSAFGARVVAERIIQAISKPFFAQSREFNAGASIGITVYPDDATTSDELIRNADIAMYHAKEQGKNNYQYYSESMNETVLSQIAMEEKLRTALSDNQFELHYQPILCTHTQTIKGVEALLRWNHPVDGLIPPDQFISICEDNGLILPIGEWVLKTACQTMKNWHDSGLDDLTVSVNVSSVQFDRQDIGLLISSALNETGLDPRYLEIEITETAIMTTGSDAIEKLKEIRALGVNLNLDDFGTGYSSLNYIRRFPINRLKIDRSFVHEIASDVHVEAIISTIIALAHDLNLEVVAEGIETKEQLKFLQSKQCNYVQGFLFSVPLAEKYIKVLLEKSNAPLYKAQ